VAMSGALVDALVGAVVGAGVAEGASLTRSTLLPLAMPA